ncbi:MAG: hypothetical protein Q9228_001908 [Teloschistes exilis]
MLSRGNSEASARLRRAKSSASIKTQRSSLESRVTDLFLAKEQALAAAHHAFGCANGSPRPSTETASQPKAWSDEQSLTRSKSIRFAGPAAVPRRELPITMRAAPRAHHVYENRRQSLYPKLKRHHSFVHGDDSAIRALPVHGEYVETCVASQPSSYRRLRKSKSMFNSYGISELIAPHSLTSQTRTATRVTNDDPGQQRVFTTSRLGQSFSFLRPNTERIPSTAAFSKASQNEAVGLARDQYLRQLEQQRSGQQPTLGDTSVQRRPPRAFRKSVRTSSGNSNGSVAESTTSQLRERTERRGIGGRARELSSSFKNRIKRVFNRSSEAEGTLPAQQLQATRPHFSETAKSNSPQISQRQAPDSLYDITPDRSSSQQRKVLHVLRKRGSRVGSVESSHSNEGVENDKSRVTSWADSTTANTVAIHQEPGRKRLSTVRENRVASLLGTLPASGSSQHRLSSSVTMPTFTLPGSPRMSGTASRFSNHTIQAQLTGPAVVSTPKVNGSPVSNPQTPENRPVGLPQEGTTDSNPKRPLRESKSMFFPQITRIERTRTSPFRQAMHSSDRPQKPQPAIVVLDLVEGMDKASSQPALSRNRDRSLTRTESLYSRSSSGNTPQPFGNSTSSARLEKNADDNLTTESLAIRLRDGESPGTTAAMSPTDESSAGWGDSRIGSSILLNIRDSPKHSLDVVSYRKRTGHKREHAQIREDDTDVGRLQSTNQLKDRSAGAHLRLADYTAIRHMASQPMIDRFPLMSMKPQANATIELKPQGSPRVTRNFTMENENRHPNSQDSQPSQTPAKLNVKHSRVDIVSTESRSRDLCQQDNGSKRDKIGPHISPQNTSRWAVSDSKTHSRSSPERLARLRRMQSSNSLRSPIIRTATGPPPGHQEWEAVQDVDGPVMLTADQGTKLTRNEIGQSPDSRRMVDIFLSKRGRPQSHVADDVVFI